MTECYICCELIDEENDEEVFYNEDCEPLCEQCYSEMMSTQIPIKLNPKIRAALEDFCNKKGISKEEAINLAIKKYIPLENEKDQN